MSTLNIGVQAGDESIQIPEKFLESDKTGEGLGLSTGEVVGDVLTNTDDILHYTSRVDPDAIAAKIAKHASPMSDIASTPFRGPSTEDKLSL